MPDPVEDSFFVPTELRTRDGELVTTVRMPPFNPPAEVIVWGSRFFVYRALPEPTYREGMPFFVPPES